MAKSAVVNSQLAMLTEPAPSGYALGRHVNFASVPSIYQTHDPRRIEAYTSHGYVVSDPQSGLQDATAFGLNYGAAISHSPTVSRSIGGFARAFFDDEISQNTHLVRVLHHEATPHRQRSATQVEALTLLANGHCYADAAARLAISEGALKARLRSARERMLCRTTAEAIQRAAENKLF